MARLPMHPLATVVLVFEAAVAAVGSVLVNGATADVHLHGLSLMQTVSSRVAHSRRSLSSSSAIIHEHDAGPYEHRLRLCNAYSHAEKGLVPEQTRDGHALQEQPLGLSGPIAYKTCKEIQARLKTGDAFNFKVNGVTKGTFSVSELPPKDSLLLLVPYGRHGGYTDMTFESHVFAKIQSAQVAVFDMYQDGAHSNSDHIRIQDPGASNLGWHGGTTDGTRSEKLRFGTVVALNQGKYEVVVPGKKGADMAKSLLSVNTGESYVVIRVGSAKGQDLMVFPSADSTAKSGARFAGGYSTLALLISVVSSMLAFR